MGHFVEIQVVKDFVINLSKIASFAQRLAIFLPNTYLSQAQLTAAIVICCQKGRSQLHDVLQVDPLTRVLLSTKTRLD